MNHHKYAAGVWLLSWVLALGGGLLFAHAEHLTAGLGLYWAITTVETVGYGDVVPHTVSGHWIAAMTMLLAIPVWSIAFAFALSWLTSLHARREGEQTRQHVTDTLGGS